MIKRLGFACIIVLLGLVLAGLFWGGAFAVSDETGPRYAVIEKEGALEIREYQTAVVAEVTLEGPREQAVNQAFGILFDYIQGNNTARQSVKMTTPVTQALASQKISMTPPVTQQSVQQNQWTTAFYLPTGYTVDSAPTPLDKRITLLERPGMRQVAIRFSGTSSPGNFEKHHQRLLDYIQSKGLRVMGMPMYAFYNAPFVPGFMRRNEIWYQSESEVTVLTK